MNTGRVNPDLIIRPSSGPAEYLQLVQIWRSAVDATHDFLADEHRMEIEDHLASDYFPHVQLYVAELDGVSIGFAGVSRKSLEMLFVAAGKHGQGIGTALLAHVVTACNVVTVDVNEQNTQAIEFYRRRDFVQVSRSELGDQNRPYPILHLALCTVTADNT